MTTSETMQSLSSQGRRPILREAGFQSDRIGRPGGRVRQVLPRLWDTSHCSQLFALLTEETVSDARMPDTSKCPGENGAWGPLR
ncbi:hypothetical protein MRX96_006584 [Rhipicephalus microplus]